MLVCYAGFSKEEKSKASTTTFSKTLPSIRVLKLSTQTEKNTERTQHGRL